MNYYQFHIADFALHTSHLSLEEEGVFRRLLDYYYDTESPIPKKTQPVIRRLRLVSHSEVVDQILTEFFILKSDGWHNLRADSEIADYNKKVETAKANGRKGGRPKKNKDLESQKTQPVILANPEETGSKANQEPVTKNQEPILKTSCSEPSASEPKQVNPIEKPVLTLPTNKNGVEFPVNQKLIDEFSELYPAVDVPQQLRGMRGWLITNRTKRKTTGGMPKFINTWLAKDQNRGGNHAAHKSTHDRWAIDHEDTSWLDEFDQPHEGGCGAGEQDIQTPEGEVYSVEAGGGGGCEPMGEGLQAGASGCTDSPPG